MPASVPEHVTPLLDEEEVRSYNNDGFLVIDDVFSSTEVEALREACESREIVGELEKRDTANKTVHLLDLAARQPAFLDLARDPRLLGRLTPLIGPDIQLQHSKLATKPPAKGKGTFAWHQDFAFFPHTNTSLAAVMVMLDDATPENGCMQIVKRSHRLGLLDHMEDGLFKGACQEEDLWSDPAYIAQITPKAGGISIHHVLALHGSEANLSGRPRRGLVFQYRADDAFQLADGIWKDTGLLMCGRKWEQVRCEGGVYQLPRSSRYKGSPFGHAWNQAGSMAVAEDV